MARQSVIIIVLIVWLIHLGGLPVLYYFQMNKAFEESSMLLKSQNKSNQYLTFYIENPGELQRLGKRECIIEGNLYDIVKSEKKNKGILLTVYPDTKEDFWYKKLSGHTNSTHKKSLGKRISLIPVFNSAWGNLKNMLLKKPFYPAQTGYPSRLYKDFLAGIPSPPPKPLDLYS
ncbi:MAG: hypothetical protein K1X92_14150 [Bacteroidia bacterium]|nr:hypothetical protein [Bacteroidia bacterium]